MNNTEEYLSILKERFLQTFKFNSVINYIFGPVLYLNFLLILSFSCAWALYLIMKILKDLKEKKLTSKQHGSLPEYIWREKMANFETNRIKNLFLLVICLSECGVSSSVGWTIVNTIGTLHVSNSNYTRNFGFCSGYLVYISLEFDTVFRISNAITTISVYSVSSLLRILTEYMVYHYSFYKIRRNLKLDIKIFLTCFLALLTMGCLSLSQKLYHICIVLALFYEFIFLVAGSKRLSKLLKQRFLDALYHENQPTYIKRYYALANREYKFFSTIFLTAFLLQNVGVSLWCIQPVIMAIFYENSYLNEAKNKSYGIIYGMWVYDLIIYSILLILLTLGTSLQIITYLAVSLRYILRNICRRIRQSRTDSLYHARMRPLIEGNQSAYMMNHYYT